MDKLHPLAVHLPIALMLLWPLVDGLGWLLKKDDVCRVGLGLLILGVVSALLATATGQAAFDVAYAQGVGVERLQTHAEPAELVPWAMVVLAALRIAGPAKMGRLGHGLAVGLGFGLWMLAYQVGNTGGALVYEHGVGVSAAKPSAPALP